MLTYFKEMIFHLPAYVNTFKEENAILMYSRLQDLHCKWLCKGFFERVSSNKNFYYTWHTVILFTLIKMHGSLLSVLIAYDD